MLPVKLSASLMCANLLEIEKDIRKLEKSGVEYLHMDIMDGVFVPNLMLNNLFLQAVRSITNLPFDIHLMITNPERKLDWFDIRPNDIVSIHYESTSNVLGSLQLIEEKGALPGVALSPATSVESIRYLLDNIKIVNVMAVNPGFAGRKMVPMTLQKIKDTREILNNLGYEHIMVEVDGNVSLDNAPLMRESGADMFVGGSSGLFLPNIDIQDAVQDLRECMEK